MMKRLCLAFLIAVILAPWSAAHSRESKTVAVLPFQINAQEDLNYLQNEIPELIKKQLRDADAVIVEPDSGVISTWQQARGNPDIAAQIGAKAGAENIVWGSLTRMGQRFSLDAKLLTISG
ncbi:MAG: hypothetical protein JRD49_04805, partial [Deltaproteobacteria bacterium]|nr:hypothetical protein [Deltaproteobacteria bacterium]